MPSVTEGAQHHVVFVILPIGLVNQESPWLDYNATPYNVGSRTIGSKGNPISPQYARGEGVERCPGACL